MFRKLVSNLPFSPALIGQVGFYARRLRKEELTRRTGLFMTVFAIIVQSLVVFVPPTSANGNNENDMCPGVTRDSAGAKKIKSCYEDNTRHYREIMDYFGISKSELWKALDGNASFRSTSTYGSWYTFGHKPRFSGDKNYSGRVPGDLYARKWNHVGNIDNGQYGWKGGSGETSFIILVDCGNLSLKRLLNPTASCVSLIASKEDISVGGSVTLTATAATDDGAEISRYNFSQSGPATASSTVKTGSNSATWARTLTATGSYTFAVSIDTSNNKDKITSKTCVEHVTVAQEKTPEYCTIPGKTTLKKDDPNCVSDCSTNPDLPGCSPNIEVTKSATNRTQGDSDATKKKANGGDVIVYSITAKNNGKTTGTVSLDDNLTDTLEYALLTDNGGATFNQSTNVLSWGSASLKPGETTTRTFIVTVKNPVPAMAQNHGTASSYDCVMSNVVRTDGTGGINVPVNCPVAKEIVEQTVKTMPATGPTENMIFAALLLSTVTFFWARSKQLGKEVRLVRKEFSGSAI